ncbi:MAG: hypothetical protein R3A52_10060 [Polyangiales bacterium]
MTIAWPYLQRTFESLERPVTVDVLIETDGPELVLAEGHGLLWLGVLSEMLGGRAMWVYAPVSSVEKRAILAGAVELWECFNKPQVLVVDEGPDGTEVMPLAGEHLPSAALPARGFVLPGWARPPLESHAPEFALAKTQGGDAIGLKALAGVASKVQRLYTAVIQRAVDGVTKLAGTVSAQVREAAELDVEAVVPGSLIIRVTPHDEGRFNEASETLRRLLTAEPEELSRELERQGPRVAARYEDLLDEVITHDLALLLSFGGTKRAFVARHTAGRRIDALPTGAQGEHNTWQALGIIDGLDPGERTFTFHDPLTDEEIRGVLAPTFVMPHGIMIGDQSPARVVELGRTRTSTRGGAELVRYQLLSIVSEPRPSTA